MTAEMERQHDDAKARKISVLRATSLKQRAKKVWTDAKKKMNVMVKMGTVKSLASNSSSSSKSAAELKAEAKERQDKQAARLDKALDEQAAAEKGAKVLELALAHDKEAAALQQRFLSKLEEAASDEERKRLLDHHEAEMLELRKRQEGERGRAERDLEKALAARKQRRQQHQVFSACVASPVRCGWLLFGPVCGL
jgi:hypothetical protein